MATSEQSLNNSPRMHPDTIDISMTGSCQLDCQWCWGDVHKIGIEHQQDSWKNLLSSFNERGTNAVVFTGGEPLMVPFLPEIAQHAKELGMRTTLSTNAVLLARKHHKVLPFIDDLGLPLDGSTSPINKIMRPGKIDNFKKVIEGANLVLDNYPDTELTIRTVIARPNVNDVANIPEVLSNQGVNLSRIRYKMYQVEPIGPRATITNTEAWSVEEDECLEVAEEVSERYPNMHNTLQLYKNTSGRYFQVGALGNAFGTLIDDDGKPKTIELGNPMKDLSESLAMIALYYSGLDTH
ncbi:MAG: Radical domain protein [Candidatus Saccharibacteria bacterium]|nr:Radical domain protein [Candidatus Saccharibacteria bacterium]